MSKKTQNFGTEQGLKVLRPREARWNEWGMVTWRGREGKIQVSRLFDAQVLV